MPANSFTVSVTPSGSDVTITVTGDGTCNSIHLVITRNGVVIVDVTSNTGSATFDYHNLTDGNYVITVTCCGETWTGGFAIGS